MWVVASDIPWNAIFVGLGAFLAGVGSVLSGLAALRAARRRNGEPAHEEVKHEAPE